MMTDRRVENEILHSKAFMAQCKGVFWSWDTPAGKLRLKRRFTEIAKIIQPESNVLEIGCGSGCFTQLLAGTRARITAIDVSPDMLAFAKSHNDKTGIIFQLEDACHTSFGPETFDIIVGNSSLHHLDLKSALKEFYRILRPGGRIFFSEPNMLNPHIFLQKNLTLFKKMAFDSPDETAFVRWHLSKVLDEMNFIKVDIVPFDFLHPWIPEPVIPFAKKLESVMEKTFLVREIAGSLFIRGEKSMFSSRQLSGHV